MLCFDFLRSTISFPRALSELSQKKEGGPIQDSVPPSWLRYMMDKEIEIEKPCFCKKKSKKNHSGGWGQWSVQAKQRKSQAITNPSSNLNTDRQMMRVCALIISFSAGYYGVVWISSMRKHMFLAQRQAFLKQKEKRRGEDNHASRCPDCPF
jgi:hypothetical protein